MSKFHINKHGVPAPCRAQKGNCPYGGESGTENHYDSIEEAQSAADHTNKQNHGILPGLQEDDYEEVDYDFVEEERDRIFNDFSKVASNAFDNKVGKPDPDIYKLSNDYDVKPPWKALEEYAERRQSNIEGNSMNRNIDEFYYESNNANERFLDEVNAGYYVPHKDISQMYERGEISNAEMNELNGAAYKAVEYYKNGVYTIEELNDEGENFMDWRELDMHPVADTGIDAFRKEFNSAENIRKLTKVD